jgi:hypothetical protein
MKTIFRQLPVTFALIMASCVHDFVPPIAAVTSTIVTKDGRLETLKVRDGLGGWGMGSEYTLVKTEKDAAYFCPNHEPSRTRALHTGDKIRIRSLHGDIYATIKIIEHESVQVFVPEVPWIIDPPSKPFPEPKMPTATNVPGQPNLVISPYSGKVIDVSGTPQGSKMLDPTTGTSIEQMKAFRVPDSGN